VRGYEVASEYVLLTDAKLEALLARSEQRDPGEKFLPIKKVVLFTLSTLLICRLIRAVKMVSIARRFNANFGRAAVAIKSINRPPSPKANGTYDHLSPAGLNEGTLSRVWDNGAVVCF
jgi:hypothetical protein